MRLIMWFKRDVWALDQRAPVMTQRLRALLDERRVHDAERALSAQHAQSEQGRSQGSDPPADSA
jgi:hypothetical protein